MKTMLIESHLAVDSDGNTTGSCPASDTEVTVENNRQTLDSCTHCFETGIKLREPVLVTPSLDA